MARRFTLKKPWLVGIGCLLVLFFLFLLSQPNELDALMRNLSEDDPYIRQWAAESLVLMGEKAKPVESELLSLLTTESIDYRLKQSLLSALINTKPDSQVFLTTLAKVLDEPFVELRVAAVHALIDVGHDGYDEVVIGLLIDALADEDDLVRYYVEKSLLSFDDIAVAQLARSLTHEQEEIRLGSARVLSRMGSKAQAAVSDLIRLLDDDSVWVRAYSLLALTNLEVPMDASPIIRSAASDTHPVTSSLADRLLTTMNAHP